MDAFAVDLQLLRTVLLPEVNLTLGRELMARVVSNEGGRGGLSIAGMLIEAELPEKLQAGQELKLQVRELSAERVVLGIQPEEGPQTPQAHAELQPPLLAPTPPPPPAGGQLLVQERHSSHGGADDPAQATHTLALRYEAPAAGPVDMYFVLAPGALHLQLTVAAGDAFDTAQTTEPALSAALSDGAERSVTISIKPRYDPVDLYV